jgi:hypothetical protein
MVALPVKLMLPASALDEPALNCEVPPASWSVAGEGTLTGTGEGAVALHGQDAAGDVDGARAGEGDTICTVSHLVDRLAGARQLRAGLDLQGAHVLERPYPLPVRVMEMVAFPLEIRLPP